MDYRIKIGISSCLLGHKVRYNGGHTRDLFLTDTLGEYVEYVPVCPEVECGFGVPREAFHLEGDPESPKLMTVKTRKDCTERMEAWAKERVLQLEKEDLCGFIFKSKSPSSGMEKVKVYNDKGMPEKKGKGIFARIFMEHFSSTPVEEDGHLQDSKLRENFVERIFALKEWREVLTKDWSVTNLVEFHTRNKLLVLSHSQKHYREMGRLVAGGRGAFMKTVYGEYEALFMDALKLKTTVKKNTNVLQHIMGCFKRQLSSCEKRELLEVIDQYRTGFVPLIVPVTLINHYVCKYRQAYLRDQTYLYPHPIALKLRNHV